jgi:hypothetical protein
LWPWLYGLLGWAVPGAGHLAQGRLWRGLCLGGGVWAMFLIGVSLGGHLYGFSESSAGLLAYVFGFCDLGTGLLYLASKALGVAVVEQSQLQTSEYGNVFLMVSGLLNYLLALDAYDIGVGRKA